MKRWAFGILAAVALASSSGAFAHFVYPGPSESVRTVRVEVTPTLTRNERKLCNSLYARGLSASAMMQGAQTEASAEYWARLARYCP